MGVAIDVTVAEGDPLGLWWRIDPLARRLVGAFGLARPADCDDQDSRAALSWSAVAVLASMTLTGLLVTDQWGWGSSLPKVSAAKLVAQTYGELSVPSALPLGLIWHEISFFPV